MNLFVPYSDAEASIIALDDKRVVKMCLETAQILSTAIRILDPETSLSVYKMTHKNHPVCVWTRASFNNYIYTLNYFKTICNEYTHRFGKTHKSFDLFLTFAQFAVEHRNLFPIEEQTPFANCTEFKEDETHTAYKKTLTAKWVKDKITPRWTNRTQPTWAY